MINEENIPVCPKCGLPMQPHYDNVGFEPPEGAPHYEITCFYCPVCKISDEDMEVEDDD